MRNCSFLESETESRLGDPRAAWSPNTRFHQCEVPVTRRPNAASRRSGPSEFNTGCYEQGDAGKSSKMEKCKFLVRISDLKARNLRLRNSPGNCATFCILNWDNSCFELETERNHEGPNPEWPSYAQFYYSVPALKCLERKTLVIGVFEQLGVGKTRVVGKAKVALMPLVTGPTHCELMLYNQGIRICKRARKALLLLDVHMSHLYQLTVKPMKIVIYANEALPEPNFSKSRDSLPSYHSRETEGSVEETGKLNALNADPRGVERNASNAQIKSCVNICLLGTGNAENVDKENFTQQWKLVFTGINHSNICMSSGTSSRACADKGESLFQNFLVFSRSGKPCSTLEDYFAVRERNRCKERKLPKTPASTSQRTDKKSKDNFRGPLWCSFFSPFRYIERKLIFHKAKTSRSVVKDRLSPTSESWDAAKHLSFNSWTSPLERRPTSEIPHIPHYPVEGCSVKARGNGNSGCDREAKQSNTQSSAALELLGPDGSSAERVPTERNAWDQVNFADRVQKSTRNCSRDCSVSQKICGELSPLQLDITSECVRDVLILFRLYGRQTGFDDLVFRGEAWLPFYEIHSPSVADMMMNRNLIETQFNQKLWFKGQIVGYIEGITVFRSSLCGYPIPANVNRGHDGMRGTSFKLSEECQENRFGLSSSHIKIPEEIKKIDKYDQALLKVLLSINRPDSLKSPSSETVKPNWKRKLLGGSTRNLTSATGKKDAKCNNIGNTGKSCLTVFGQLIEVLKLPDSNHRRTFSYPNSLALLMGQWTLISLASHVLELIDFLPWGCKAACSAVLFLILRREELDQASVVPVFLDPVKHFNGEERFSLYLAIEYERGFRSTIKSASNEESEVGVAGRLLSEKGSKSDYLQREDEEGRISTKIRSVCQKLNEGNRGLVTLYHKQMLLCRKYYLVMARTFFKALATLCRIDSTQQAPQKLISNLFNLCYFRLPHVSKYFLSAILQEEDRDAEIPEWDSSLFKLDSAGVEESGTWESGYEHAVGWKAFHDSLKEYFGEITVEEMTHYKNETSDQWKSFLTQKGDFFFHVLEYWARYLYQRTFDKKRVQWHLVPGYATMLKALLLEMKRRDVRKYPGSLLSCTGAFLMNEALLSSFVKIIFKRTIAFDISAVSCCLDHTDYWMQGISLRHEALPSNFDSEFFQNGIRAILSSELTLCISKVLWLLYKNFSCFTEKFSKPLILDLICHDYFYRLFCHWSKMVRCCFMSLLLYRICEVTRKLLARETQDALNFTHFEHSEKETSSQNLKDSTLEKTILLAYLEISKRLKRLGVQKVFPEDLVTSLINPLMKKHVKSESENKRKPIAAGGPRKESLYCDNGDNPSCESQVILCEETIIPESCLVYVKVATTEFAVEIENYREWISTGTPVPQMIISPFTLDYEVDGPPDYMQ